MDVQAHTIAPLFCFYLVFLIETHVFQRILQVHPEYRSLLGLGEPEGGRADQHSQEVPRAVRVGGFLVWVNEKEAKQQEDQDDDSKSKKFDVVKNVVAVGTAKNMRYDM